MTPAARRAGAILVVALALAGTARAQPPRAYLSVPDTVSSEWQALLRTLTDPTTNPAEPSASDAAGWARRRAEIERHREAVVKATLERWQPAVAEKTLGGVPVLDITPRGWTDDGRRVVFVHGGGYTLLSARSTLPSAALIAEATGRRVVSVDYTAAPAATWRRVPDEVVAVLRALPAEGVALNRLAVVGESAGGGLAAGVALRMREAGHGMPAALVLWSPWSDLTERGDTRQTLARAEPYLVWATILKPSADAYAAPADQRHPHVSPVYGDFTKPFPPTLIQVGTKEILLSDAVRLYRAIDAGGGAATLDVYEGMPHSFQAQRPESPESRQALRKVKAFLDRHLGR